MKKIINHVVYTEDHSSTDLRVFPIVAVNKAGDGKCEVVLADGSRLSGAIVRYATSKEVTKDKRITATVVGYSQ